MKLLLRRNLALIALGLPLLATSCATRRFDITTTQRAVFEQRTERTNGVWNAPVPWSIIDRGPIGGPPGPTREIPAGLPKAGFSTTYERGPDPFPGERLATAAFRGVFRFDFRDFLSRNDPSSILRATLTIEEALPDREVALQWGEPWADSDGGRLISRPVDNIVRRMDFRVSGVTGSWSSMGDAAAPQLSDLATTDLAARRRRISVPLSRPVSIDVTEEIRQFLAAPNTNFGFAIEPIGDYLRFKANNRMMVGFRVRLILLLQNP